MSGDNRFWQFARHIYYIMDQPKILSTNLCLEEPFFDEYGNIVDSKTYEVTEQWIADTYIRSDSVVLELGGRYGLVSAKINAKLKDKGAHLVVEPCPHAFRVMCQNLANHGAGCICFNGTISTGKMFFQSQGTASKTRYDQCANSVAVPNRTLDDIIKQTGLKFDTLVADCEGALGMFFKENDHFIGTLKMVTFEEDCHDFCDYEEIKRNLISKGFKCVKPGGHSVWVR
jgi:FkbM family methyltransferase